MYAIELLNLFSSKQVVDELSKIPWLLEEIDWDMRIPSEKKKEAKEKVLEAYEKALDNIKSTYNKDNVEINDDSLLVFLERFGENGVYDANLLKIKEDKKKILKAIDINDIEDAFNFNNPMYAVDFSSRDKILGYKLSDYNLNKVGKLICAASLLYVLTAFGLDEDDRSEKIEKIENDLEESIDNEKEGLVGETITHEELMKALGRKKVKKTPLQKIASNRERHKNHLELCMDIIDLIYDIQEILFEEGVIDESFIDKTYDTIDDFDDEED